MRVIHFLDYFNEFTGNPSQVYANEMQNLGHTVEIFTSDKVPTPSGYDDSKSQLKIRRFLGIRFFSKCFFPGVIPHFFSKVKENDVVHAHVLGFFSTFVAGYMKFFKKFKLVITADFDPLGKKQGFLKSFFNYFFFVVPAKNADAIICFTNSEKKELVERFGISEKNITVLPIGVYYGEFQKVDSLKLKKQLGLDKKFVLLSVCYLSRKKNLEMGLNALQKIGKEEVVFMHVGGWSDLEYKKELDELVQELGLKNRVYFLGEKKLQEIKGYYKAGNIFLNLGFNESYAIPVLEAMASGLPVVSTKTGIGFEIIVEGKNGFFAQNSNEASEKISFLEKNPLQCQKMGKNNVVLAKDFDWKKIIAKLEKIYMSV